VFKIQGRLQLAGEEFVVTDVDVLRSEDDGMMHQGEPTPTQVVISAGDRISIIEGKVTFTVDYSSNTTLSRGILFISVGRDVTLTRS
jgi:hypothetical protein